MKTLIHNLETELVILKAEYHNATRRASDLIEEYKSKNPSSHFGHNLASAAADLSTIAGKINSIERVLDSARMMWNAICPVCRKPMNVDPEDLAKGTRVFCGSCGNDVKPIRK